ncbi:MAG: DUF4234 domain-containing protein [Lentisphaeria bacterium]|nr:DUF4234 domain-containing protein [Lentisphaeria bacterium]
MTQRSIIVMVILTFITCGLYNIFWMYMARAEFKQYANYSDINPALELLLCLLCFPFFYYWVFKFSADIAKFQGETGRAVTDNSVINLILAILGLGLVSELIIQNQLNELE